MVKKIRTVLYLGVLFAGFGTIFLGKDFVAAEENVIEYHSEQVIDFSSEESVYVAGEYVGKIVITEQPTTTPRSLIHSEAVQNKNYNVHFIGGTANVGFGITVNNKNITRAYDPWANGLGWSINPGRLTFNSKEAKLPGSFSVAWKGFPAGSIFRLRAVISGNQLQTHLDIP